MLRATLPRRVICRQFSNSVTRWDASRSIPLPPPPSTSPTPTPTPSGTPRGDNIQPQQHEQHRTEGGKLGRTTGDGANAGKPLTGTSEEHHEPANKGTPPIPPPGDAPASGSPQDTPHVATALATATDRLREWSAQAAVAARARADDWTAATKTTFSQLGAQLNKATGYEEIEALKRDVVAQELRINETRQAAREAKVAYDEAASQRLQSQRDVNDLLQRKNTWTNSDVERFTTLVRQDHLFEQAEARAKAAVEESETCVEQEFSQLMRTILARYHEEQVWSDKIRSASTYGSLAALGLNLVVFLMAIVVVEPWKRRRLAQTFEKKVEELSREGGERLEASMGEVGRQLREQEALLAAVAGEMRGALEKAERQVVAPEPSPSMVVAEAAVEAGITDPGLPLTGLSRGWELGVVGASAFLTGVLGCLFFGR